MFSLYLFVCMFWFFGRREVIFTTLFFVIINFLKFGIYELSRTNSEIRQEKVIRSTTKRTAAADYRHELIEREVSEERQKFIRNRQKNFIEFRVMCSRLICSSTGRSWLILPNRTSINKNKLFSESIFEPEPAFTSLFFGNDTTWPTNRFRPSVLFIIYSVTIFYFLLK